MIVELFVQQLFYRQMKVARVNQSLFERTPLDSIEFKRVKRFVVLLVKLRGNLPNALLQLYLNFLVLFIRVAPERIELSF